MYIKPCPECGRNPKIYDCISNPKFKNGIRRRFCICPGYCSVIPREDGLYTFYFKYDGDGDDNVIYKEWNAAIQCYLDNVNKPWYEREYKWR